MLKKLRAALAAWVVLSAAFVAGCDNSSNDDDGSDGSENPYVGALHAVRDLGAVTFLREEEEWSSIEFGTGTDFRSVGADQYDFNFDALLPGDKTSACTGDNDGDDIKDDNECTRLESVSINALRNHEYTVVLFGSYAAREVLVFDRQRHVFDTVTSDGDPADEDAEVQFLHLAQSLGAVDVYVEPPGTNLSPVQARGSLSLRGEIVVMIDEGEYVLTLTAVGDPSTVYFTSEAFPIDAQTRVGFAIRDGAGAGTSTLVVNEFRDRSATLLDRNVTTELRIAHVAQLGGNVDVYVGGNFATPFAPNLGFAEMSPYGQVDGTRLIDLDVDVTPAGNPSAFLSREEIDLVKGERATFFILGSTAGLDGVKSVDAFRRLATHAQVRLINGASTSLDFYVVPRGSNIATLSPTANVASRQSSGLRQFAPGTYDIVLTKPGTSIAVFGPDTVILEANGIYTIAATDTGEATSASVELLDDFAN